jgi:hypothetical protein
MLTGQVIHILIIPLWEVSRETPPLWRRFAVEYVLAQRVWAYCSQLRLVSISSLALVRKFYVPLGIFRRFRRKILYSLEFGTRIS